MNDDKIGLSRRKMLVGLGAVGVASAGAGLGTTAYFNDTETFENNTLTAGELDLFVHVDYSEDQGSFGDYSTPEGTYIDGNVVGGGEEGETLSIEVSDLKPGDSGEGEFCFSIVDNPAYMWMCGELTANDENGMNEPEMDDDETPDMGDLADAMEVTVSYCDTDGNKGDPIVSGSLADVMGALVEGVPLSGDGDSDAPLAGRPAFEGVEQAFDGDNNPVVAEQCVCFEWIVPTSVENEIQSDSVMFDFEFYAVQSRHNDGTHNPCIESVEGEGFPELEDSAWHARGIYGNGGGAANRELDIRLPDDTPVHSGNENVAWPNGQPVPFELTIDGGDAKWTVDSSEVTVSPAPLPASDTVVIMAKASSADSTIELTDIAYNGSSPTGADSVFADGNVGEQQNISLSTVAFGEGDTITGNVTMSWPAGSPPNREGLGFRIDV